MYYKLVIKVNTIDTKIPSTDQLVTKAQYDLGKLDLEKKIKDADKKNRGGSRTTATSKMERFVIIVYGFQPLTNVTKRSILGVAATLDLPLKIPNTSRLFKTDYKTKVAEIENKMLNNNQHKPPLSMCAFIERYSENM